MRWLVIDRALVRRLGVSGRVEGPAVVAPDPILASDRDAAEALMPRDTATRQYSVVALLSWQQMSDRERRDLLAGTPLPPDPKDHPYNAYREAPSDHT